MTKKSIAASYIYCSLKFNIFLRGIISLVFVMYILHVSQTLHFREKKQQKMMSAVIKRLNVIQPHLN